MTTARAIRKLTYCARYRTASESAGRRCHPPGGASPPRTDRLRTRELAMRMRTSVMAAVLAAAGLLGGAGRAEAAFITTSDRGWYLSDGTHGPTNPNYLVG